MATTATITGTSVNEINPKIDLTVRVFDNFYNFQVIVPVDEYDAVNSYFLTVFKTKAAADSFTTTLFRIAQETNTPVLTLLAQISNQDQIQLTNTLAYYLNGMRSPSTLVGIYNATVPNYYTARNVLP